VVKAAEEPAQILEGPDNVTDGNAEDVIFIVGAHSPMEYCTVFVCVAEFGVYVVLLPEDGDKEPPPTVRSVHAPILRLSWVELRVTLAPGHGVVVLAEMEGDSCRYINIAD